MWGYLRQGGGANPSVYSLNLGIPGPARAGFLINATDLGARCPADRVMTGDRTTMLAMDLSCKDTNIAN